MMMMMTGCMTMMMMMIIKILVIMMMMIMMMICFSHYLLCSHAKVVGKLKGLVRVVEDEVCCITFIDAYSTQ